MVIGHVLPTRAAFQIAGGTGEEADLVGHHRNLLGPGQPERLAGVLGLDLDQFLGVIIDGGGHLEQRLHPVLRGGLPPDLGKSAGSRRDGPTDVRRPGQRRSRVHLAGRGVDDVGIAALDGLDELAVDEVGERLLRIGHGAS